MIPILIAVLILVLIALTSALYIGPKTLLMPERRTPEYYRKRFGFSHPSEIGLRFETRTLTTSDGYKLAYWTLDDSNCKETAGAVIYLHGITDSKVSGLNYAKELAKFCQKIFLIDMRRHGESEGKYCTYGYYEKHDVVRLIDEIELKNPQTEITLLGVSMGGAIAIQTAAIDKRVSRVIAIAPFYDLFSIALDHEFNHIGIRNKALLRFVLHRAEKVANFKASEVSPAKDIQYIEVPVLIVHGEEDKTVKIEYSQKLTELGKNARLLVVPGAGHVDVLEKGGKGYVEKLSIFLKRA